MRPYEVMVIFDVGLEDGDINAGLDRITSLVRDRGGSPGRVERWGRRSFAYELKHRSEGYYVLIEFMAEATLVADLDRMLTLDDIVLRHKVMRQPDRQSGRALRAEAKRRETAIRKAARAKAAS
ncbi:MAG: 30S ribosomal protein S6 [Acidimicrobiales bacterium]